MVFRARSEVVEVVIMLTAILAFFLVFMPVKLVLTYIRSVLDVVILLTLADASGIRPPVLGGRPRFRGKFVSKRVGALMNMTFIPTAGFVTDTIVDAAMDSLKSMDAINLMCLAALITILIFLSAYYDVGRILLRGR